MQNNTITDNTYGLYIQTGSKPLLGSNVITGNKSDVYSEQALNGDSTVLSTKRLWEIMNELY
jgi:parallel beta-helix repeat protein